MHLDLIGEKFDGAIRALARLPSQLPLGSGTGLDDRHRAVLATLARARAATASHEAPQDDGSSSEESPRDRVVREHGTEYVLAALRTEWVRLAEALRHRRPPGKGPVTDLDALPVGSGAEIDGAIAALQAEQGLADLALSACHEHGWHMLGAALETAARTKGQAAGAGPVERLLAGQYRGQVVDGVLQDAVRAVNQDLSTAGIGAVRATKRPKAVRGNGVLLLPISVRKLVIGEHGCQLISEVALPVPEHSVDVVGPSMPVNAADSGEVSSPGDAEETHGAPRPPWAPSTPNAELDEEGFAVTGRPGLRSSTFWEGFSRIEDDLGNHYLTLIEVEKAQPGLCRLFGTQRVTQTLFPGLAPGARRLELTNPGHLVSLVPTRGGQPAARPETRTVPDGASITVAL